MPTEVEAARLAALRSYNILDTPADAAFDRFVHLACTIFDTPMSTITLIDADRQWFKARIGIDVPETPRDVSFCAVAIETDALLLVPDALEDPRFADNPMAHAAPHYRFYAGAPLITLEGHRVGTLAIADRRPRYDLDIARLATLTELATLVVTQLELQREQRVQARTSADLSMINEILTLLGEAATFREAIDRTITALLRFTGGAYAHVWERRRGEDMVHLIATQSAIGPTGDSLPALFDGLPMPLSQVAMAALFDRDGDTVVRVLTPQDDAFPVLAAGRARGLASFVAHALAVGDSHYVLGLAFYRSGPALAEAQRLLGRLSHAIRPVLGRKVVEERMTLLTAALAATQDGVMITEAEPMNGQALRAIYVNDANIRMTGYSAAELLGRPPRLLDDPQAQPSKLAGIRAALATSQSWRTELANIRKDGSQFWVELDIVPLVDEVGWVTHWMWVQRDVTARREATEQQREREQEARRVAGRLRELSDQLLQAHRFAKLGTWRWWVGSDSLEWSDNMYEMFGVTSILFTPMLSATQLLIHPEDRDNVRTHLARAVEDRANTSYEFRTQGPDGLLRHCWAEGYCDVGPDGTVISVHGICQDVTERKKVEGLLLRTEKLNSIGQLTGGIAHDFNNLLTVISLNLEILGDMMGPDHPAQEVLEPVMRATASGAQLTSSLLSFARRQPLQPQPAEVGQVLAEIIALASRSLGERHAIVLTHDPGLPACLLDRAQFESAVLNLLVNARDAMPDGGTIGLSASDVALTRDDPRAITELPPGSYVVVSVQDTGDGIPPDVLEKVFEPFFTTKEPGRGTGLGLSMVIGFAKQSGGHVDIESTVGLGTTVRLYLPSIA